MVTHTALGLVVLIVAAHVVLLAVAYGLARLVVWASGLVHDDAEIEAAMRRHPAGKKREQQ